MSPSTEQPITRLDIGMAALSLGLVGGFFIDLWAHSHGRVDDTFLTPWHAVLYAMAAAILALLGLIAFRARSEGQAWRESLPAGYGLSLVGALLFMVAGLADLAWHEVFGFEEDIEDLLSPTHLVLASSGVFMVAGPVRSAWIRGTPDGFPRWLPWVAGLTAMLSIFTAFTSYAHPAVDTWPTVSNDRPASSSALVSIEIDSGDLTRHHTTFSDEVFLPDVGPDGSIVVAAPRDDVGSLVVFDASGRHTRIWEGPGIFLHPDVSPDGRLVAFTSVNEAGGGDIFTVPIEGGQLSRLTESDAFDWSASWSPDGSRIVFSSFRGGDADLYVMNSDGSALSPLLELEGDQGAPDWSPDGERIVFEHNSGDGFDLFLIDANGSNMTRLTDLEGFEISPSFSHDGRRVAFGSNRDGDIELFVVDVEGGVPTKIGDNPTGDEAWAGTSWAVDDSSIVTNSSGWDPYFADEINARVSGVSSVLIQAALIAGFVLLILRHGPLPIGALTFLLTVNGALMTVFSDNFWFAVAAFMAGVVSDALAYLVRSWDLIRTVRLLSAAVPFAWYALYLVALTMVEGPLVWSIHMTGGAPILAGLVGLLMSLVVFPAEREAVLAESK